MVGSTLPVVVSHAQGRVVFEQGDAHDLTDQMVLRYVDDLGKPTTSYPANPNGSPGGITGLTSRDGRVTLLMPHPERIFRSVQCSWHPSHWPEYSPWMQMFINARQWV